MDAAKVVSFYQKHYIERSSLLGSVLREESGPASDVDVLVEFEPGHVPGFASLQLEVALSGITERNGDLNAPGFLGPCFQDQLLAKAEVQYDRTALMELQRAGQGRRWLRSLA